MPPCVIFNPTSNRGRSAQHARRLQDICARHAAQWLPTHGPGDAELFARRMAETGCDRVVAMGGDGTIHEVLNGLLAAGDKHGTTMGVVPSGAGNDFVHALGLPTVPEAAMTLALTAAARPMDVGRVTDGSQRSRYWVNSLGAMLDGAINMESHRWKRPRGPARYLLATLRLLANPFPIYETRWNVDGVCRTLPLVLLAVANGPREGGVFTIAPDAKNDDGRLDYLAIKPITRGRMMTVVPQLLAGKACRGRKILRGQATQMHVATDRPLIIHLDGELWARPDQHITDITIETMPGMLAVAR